MEMIRDAIKLEQVARITNGTVMGVSDRFVRQVATDSRSLPGIEDVMFVAIRGERHDGNDYIDELYNRGVRCFLTDRQPQMNGMEEASFCFVKDALTALQVLAAERRRSFPGMVIGITGSNGKTIVKEWLSQMLQHEMSVVRSPRSYNSQLGVPLSLWQLSGRYQVAVIEAGISLPGEMLKLERMIAPDIGILTNIGSAHSENFRSDSEKLREKLQLFRNSKKLVYRSDTYVDGKRTGDYLKELKLEMISWAYTGEADYTCQILQLKEGQKVLDVSTGQESHRFSLPFSDDASVENLIHVVVLMKELGIAFNRIDQLLQQLEPVEMRLETLKGLHGSTLVNDVYNSDLAGLKVALDVLMQQQSHNDKLVILSDLYQSGLDDRTLYGEVAGLLKFKDIQQIYCIGDNIAGQRDQFPGGTMFFHDTETFLQKFDPKEIENSAVLIKGARKFHFEDITRQLQLQYHKTVLEINISEMVRNLNYYRSLLKPSTRIMVMVKALSYGAGAHEIAEFLQHEKIDYLAVAFPDEGIRLRKSGVQLPVMVMNTDPGDYRKLLENQLEPEIYSREGLERFLKDCRYMGLSNQPVHIKLDTGMHRLGFEEKDLDWLTRQLAAREMKVKSLFTHLAGSDDPSLDEFTRLQVAALQKMAGLFQPVVGDEILLHALNTSGIERFPELQMDMVRVGIGLYGQGVNKKLEPVSTFRTIISQIREVAPGESVGYGRSGVVKRPSRIATIPVGYADGINRHLGNGNYSFYLNGGFAPTIGHICMDMTMLDITDNGATVGDQVELFGRNCPVSRMAGQLDTIVYEILTSIPERVKRIYIRE
jgi:Alr-MurF fusion protein